jgi:hypothetical protein
MRVFRQTAWSITVRTGSGAARYCALRASIYVDQELAA